MASSGPGPEPPSLDTLLNSLVYIIEAHKSRVKSRRDWCLLFAHGYLLASEFTFAGLQQQQAGGGAPPSKSPILPADCWSDSSQSEDLVLLYNRRGTEQQHQEYVLCIATMGSDLIVTLAHQDTAFNCTIPGGMLCAIDASVDGQAGVDSIRLAYPQVEQLHTLMWEQLFLRLPFNQQRHSQHQNQQQQQRHQQQQQQQRYQQPIPMPQSSYFPQRQQQPAPSPFDYGRADLDPFGGAGGGMRFDPLRIGGARGGGPAGGGRFGPIRDPFSGQPLPPGAVPPGARFDPFGPPGPPDMPAGGNPDPDNLRPPGWEGGGGSGGFGGFGSGRGRGGGGGGFYI